MNRPCSCTAYPCSYDVVSGVRPNHFSCTTNFSHTKRHFNRLIRGLVLTLFFFPGISWSAANLVLDSAPITWNIIGLDHNNVNVGPQDFPVGVRVLNTGDQNATNVNAQFEFTSANSLVNLLDDDTLTTTVIPPGGFADFYFTVRVTRNAAAYDTMRDYRITITGGGLGSPLVTEDTLFVEGLISQEANDVLSLLGPPVIQQGEVRTFVLTCETQTNREQLETFVNFPNEIFQVLSIENTFTHPSATTIDRYYVDACGWLRDNLPPDNNSCDGPDQFGGRVGGDVMTVYTVLVLQTPTSTINLSALILDLGGSAFHYNSDFGEDILPVNPPSDLFVIKTAIDNPVEAGDTVEYLITVVNPSQTIVAKNVVLEDTLPAGLTFVSAAPVQNSGPNPLRWNIGDMAASSTLSFRVIAQTSCDSTGEFTNTATVSSTTPDNNPGNNTTSQTILVQDTTPPAIQCPAPIILSSDAGQCSRGNVTFTVSASDNCDEVTVTSVPPSGSTFPVGTTTVTSTATDAAGNTATCTFNVTITDVQPPAISCPPAINLAADAQSCSRANVTITSATATDNCTAVMVTASRSDNMPLNSPFPVGTTTITWKATDGANNMATCLQLVTIRDATAPAIQCPANINRTADQGQCQATNVTYSAVATDNCSTAPVTVTFAPPSGSNFPVGTTIVTVTATDSAGNQATCTFNVTVTDGQLPTITCPPTINVNADSQTCQAPTVNIVQPTIADNCPGATVAGVRNDGMNLNAPYPVGTTIITWTVTDASGNTASCQQQVIVADNTPPTISCPPTINVNASAQNCQAANVNIVQPTVNDNCANPTVMGSRSDGLALNAPYPLGTTTITWKATDASGNMAQCTQLVVVSDVTAPTINCPQVVNVANSPGLCGAFVNYTVTTSDACGNGNVTLVCTPAPGSFFPVGTTAVTCTATDLAGNQATCSFNVVVTDNENPILLCPPNIATCMQDIVLGTPVTSDNCATDSLTILRSDNLPLSADYPVGTTLVTYTLTDSAGNMASCVQTVMVSDSVLPQIICPADLTIPALAGQCVSGPVNYPDPTVLDNCSTDTTGLTISFVPPEGTVFPLGETIVTATVTDSMQNSASCTFTVRVVDVTPPPLVCPANIVVDNTPGQCQASSVNFNIPVTDACSNPVTVVATPPSGSPFPVGTTTVNVTATDSAGNVATCSFTVTVNDTQPPSIQCPQPLDIMADVNMCQVFEVDLGLPITGDNCAVASVLATRSDGQLLTAPYPVGTTTITWTVTDSSGNTATCLQTVTVRDRMMPTITCPPNISVDALAGQCLSGPVEYGNAIVSDNCSTAPENLVVTFVPPSGSTFPIGVNTVTATVTDPGGNQASCTFTVTVVDVTPPQITCPANIVVSNTPGLCGSSQVAFEVLASDGCSNPVTVVANPPSGTVFPVGVTTVVATATDSAGNSATCSFTVTVNDTQPPTITCPQPIVVSTSSGQCEAANVTYSATASDNCEGPVTVTFNPPSGSNLPVGVTTVEATATDTAGNTATCTFTVTVEDTDAPRIQCGDTVTVATVPCEVDAIVVLTPPEALDPCGPVSIVGTRSDNRPLTDRFPAAQTTVTWTATDANGNDSMCTQLVIVEESQCQPICDGPDLVIMTKMAPTFKCGGKVPKCKVKGWYVVTNIGTQTSNETSVCFYLSDDQVLDPSDIQFKPSKKRHRVKSLRPGEMVGVDLNGKTPKGVTVEGKFILGFVDCPGVVAECREDNNTTADIPQPKTKK